MNLSFKFNQPLKARDIPNSVTHLKFGHYFNQPLKAGDIPNSVTHLKFGIDFNQQLNNNNISNNIIELLFFHTFNKDLILFDKNILIAKYTDFVVIYDELNINIRHYIYKKLLKICENLTKDKLKGNIIYKELIERVFHPKRLFNISKIYNIDIERLLTLY